ncbi:MAG: ATP-binding protein [Bdellovibrionales bacterium]|jgi:hypothetical protein|nr:ATP-binding protein [Bdellovibrionales bacterium]
MSILSLADSVLDHKQTQNGAVAQPVAHEISHDEQSPWTALEALNAAVWRLDLRSGRTEMSPEARRAFEDVFNVDPQCLEEGRFGFASHAHPDDRDRLLALLAAGMEKPFRTHFRVVDRDGAQRWVQLKVSRLFAKKSEPEELQPIGDSLYFLAENDTEEKAETERQKRVFADRILSSLFGQNLSALAPEEFSSLTLMAKISEKWEAIILEKGIRWMGADLAPLGPASVIEGSEPLLILMMDSVFENAIDAALASTEQTQPWIRFEFFEDTDSVFFALTDSGPGVPIVHRGQIFEPFFSTQPEAASGLGLTLARSAAEWHGGTLRLDHFSKNTRFVAQIPKQFRKKLD